MFGVLIGLMPNNNAVNLRSASVQVSFFAVGALLRQRNRGSRARVWLSAWGHRSGGGPWICILCPQQQTRYP